MRCDECGTRLDAHPFRYDDWSFCCECMAALCSWFLEGGTVEDPNMFAHLNIHPDEEAGDAAV